MAEWLSTLDAQTPDRCGMAGNDLKAQNSVLMASAIVFAG